jgi:nucleoside-diphosphate-sugar epimerase
MKTILVTGGAGYIGSLLLPSLLKNNKVILYDNFLYGFDPILHFAENKNLQIVKDDVRNISGLKEFVRKADDIVHLAAIVGYPACGIDVVRAKSTNVGGAKNIVKLISKDQNLIFASTGSTYGRVQNIATEETSIEPLTLYGKTKADAEKVCMNSRSKNIALRFATVFGISPRMRLDLLINNLMYDAIHLKQLIIYEGEFKRTFIHNSDAVRSIIFCLNNFNKLKNQIYNIGDNKMNYKKIEIAKLIQKYTKCFIYDSKHGTDLDKRDYKVSYEKINQKGFKCEIILESVIHNMLKVISNMHITNKWSNV